ncbi:hypothetical protein A4A49_38861 [Nicotiana attenuata]|uniref:Uncharacterized protein n=1 Tax=Nicotiana attenuata TaxID=49451 RepID=A0A1J6JQV7_NICAT|nr:hypothetical protein A4A49_38861 [Nicotiana attenuata]
MKDFHIKDLNASLDFLPGTIPPIPSFCRFEKDWDEEEELRSSARSVSPTDYQNDPSHDYSGDVLEYIFALREYTGEDLNASLDFLPGTIPPIPSFCRFEKDRDEEEELRSSARSVSPTDYQNDPYHDYSGDVLEYIFALREYTGEDLNASLDFLPGTIPPIPSFCRFEKDRDEEEELRSSARSVSPTDYQNDPYHDYSGDVLEYIFALREYTGEDLNASLDFLPGTIPPIPSFCRFEKDRDEEEELRSSARSVSPTDYQNDPYHDYSGDVLEYIFALREYTGEGGICPTKPPITVDVPRGLVEVKPSTPHAVLPLMARRRLEERLRRPWWQAEE